MSVPQMLHDEASTRSSRIVGFLPGIVLESLSRYRYSNLSRTDYFATSAPVTKGNLRWFDQSDFYFGSKTFVPPTFSASCAILVAHTLECAFLRACQC